MAVTITHPFVSAISDDPAAVTAGQVVPSNWNATHSISGTLDVSNGGTGVTTSTGTGSVVLSTGPTFAPDVVISGSSSNSALRITQTGTGNALLVEDSASTDSTPFIVTADGRVGMGVPNASYFPGNIGLYITANDGNYRTLFQRMSDDSSGPQFFFRKVAARFRPSPGSRAAID